MLKGVITCTPGIAVARLEVHQEVEKEPAAVSLTSSAQPAVVRKDSVTYDFVTIGSCNFNVFDVSGCRLQVQQGGRE